MAFSFLALSVEQMVAISGDLLDKRLAILQSVPYAACYIDDLKEAHKKLFLHLPKGASVPLAVQLLQDKSKKVDFRHDRLYRGSNHLLEAHQELAETEEEEKELSAIQAHYFPRGGSGTTLTYQEEAGAGRILAEKLSSDEAPNPEYRDKVKTIIAKDSETLFDTLGKIVEVSQELGEVDNAKTQALKDAEDDIKASTGTSARKAQYEWIDVTKKVFEGLERGHQKGKLSDDDRDKVFAELTRAKETVEKRSAKKAEPQKPSEPAPAPPKDPTLEPGSTPEDS